jgi:hypothetical protein
MAEIVRDVTPAACSTPGDRADLAVKVKWAQEHPLETNELEAWAGVRGTVLARTESSIVRDINDFPIEIRRGRSSN